MEFEALSGHPFPLLQGGGVILIGAGLGVLLASLSRTYFVLLFLLGFAGGFAALYWLDLAVPFDQVPTLQVWGFFGAIVFEVVAIAYVIVRHQSDYRILILGIILAVALHFVVMALSHGPAMLAAGMASASIVAAGLLIRRLPLEGILVADGSIKLAAGVFMTIENPAWRWSDVTRAFA